MLAPTIERDEHIAALLASKPPARREENGLIREQRLVGPKRNPRDRVE